MRSGTSAASSTSASTASTATSRPATATRSRTTGKASLRSERRTITFADLQREVVRFANALKDLGVKKGTPVAIYMGMVPELPVAMLACARLGAPHTVVFGGFSAESLSDRMNDMECELLITQDEGWRAGKKVPLKRNADDAVAQAPTVKKVVVLRRTGDDVPFDESRDAWWHELTEGQDDDPASAPPEPMDAEDLLYLLYTSGTTAKPKGHRAHDGRLPRRRRIDAPLHLRHQARLRLLVRGRRRLGDRAQLHRLRPAHERDDRRHVRGRAELSEPGTLVGDRRAVQGRHPLHRADRDSLAHEVGARARRRSTISRRCACSAASASRSIPRPGSGTASTSAATAPRSWTPGGRRRPA